MEPDMATLLALLVRGIHLQDGTDLSLEPDMATLLTLLVVYSPAGWNRSNPGT
jgi:hypothetical protein